MNVLVFYQKKIDNCINQNLTLIILDIDSVQGKQSFTLCWRDMKEEGWT